VTFYAVISTLLTFVTTFRKAHEENLKQAELEKKKAEKEAEAEKAKNAQLTGKNVVFHILCSFGLLRKLFIFTVSTYCPQDSKPSNPRRQAKQTLERTRSASRRGRDVG
jgi:hypothetical protein